MNRKMKQIMAITAIVLLAGLYITTLALSFSKDPNAQKWFMACIYATIVVPILMYVYSWLYKMVRRKAEESKDKDYTDPS